MSDSSFIPRVNRQERQKPRWWQIVAANFSLLLFLVLGMGGMFAVYLQFSPTAGDAEAVAALVAGASGLYAPITKPVPARPVTQRVQQSPKPIRVGIISGHSGNDSGAVCDDGLTEAQVNMTIASRVISRLAELGIETELLMEFDPRLQGYAGTALLSIHADSCQYYNDQATGFKLAGSSYTDSSRLSICLQNSYREATQMAYHSNTITPHMTDYHAFREIAPGVEAVILEVGFMYLDRQMLTTDVDRPVTGVTNGILCFLQESQP